MELKNKFGFHDYYGENWDALWDLMRDVFDDGKQALVEIYGFNSLEKKLRNECEVMLKIFDRLNNIEPTFVYKIIS